MKTKPNRAVRALRKTLEKTQAQFAMLLGVSKDTVVSWENGRNRIEPRTAFAIYATTGASPGDILSNRACPRYFESGEAYTLRHYWEFRGRMVQDGELLFNVRNGPGELLRDIFKAAVRPGGGGNEDRITGVFDSFMEWCRQTVERFDLGPELKDVQGKQLHSLSILQWWRPMSLLRQVSQNGVDTIQVARLGHSFVTFFPPNSPRSKALAQTKPARPAQS